MRKVFQNVLVILSLNKPNSLRGVESGDDLGQKLVDHERLNKPNSLRGVERAHQGLCLQ